VNRPFYDGNFSTPRQVGPVVTSIDETTRATISKVPFWVRAGQYRPQTRGSRRSGIDGFLVEQPEPRSIGADIVEYELIYATLPPIRTEPEPWVYNLQFVSGTDLVEIPTPTVSHVKYSYVHTASPLNIPLEVAFKATKIGDYVAYVGTKPRVGQRILAEDEQLRRWRGDIWEKISRTVIYKSTARI
jgi:hypothetical protein